jgi:guanylate kinase
MARGTETESTLKTRVDNAASEINVATENKDSVIGFKFINDDLAEANILFEVIVKSLYSSELPNI